MTCFDFLHGDSRLSGCFFQERPHCFQLFLHLTHILSCAQELNMHNKESEDKYRFKQTILSMMKSPCPGQLSYVHEPNAVPAFSVQSGLRKYWAAPGSSWVSHSYVVRAQRGIARTCEPPSGGSLHTLPSTNRRCRVNLDWYVIDMQHTQKNWVFLTMPLKAAGLASSSGSSLRKDVATDCKASCGQALNQSIVQHVTREGNCLSLARNTSPIGLAAGRYIYFRMIPTRDNGTILTRMLRPC